MRSKERNKERERGVEEKNREMRLNAGIGVSSTVVIRIHFVEMVSRFESPSSFSFLRL